MVVQPLPPRDEDIGLQPSTDLAQGGYSLAALERLLSDCDGQPIWRDVADVCCAYYDGDQLTAAQIDTARKNGLEPRSTNLIQRVINGVLGQEAKSRRDPHLEPDDDDYADVADVQSMKLKEAQRETCADMAISNAYAGQVKAGIGWVEVSRVADPLEYPYRVQEVHRSEMWWDWRAKKVDLSDARWLCRRRWVDLDDAQATFPEFKEVLEYAGSNWASFMFDDMMEERIINRAFETDRAFRVNRSEWINGGRRRIRMYEVWYRVPALIVVMKVGPRWIPYDENSPAHQEAVARGLVPIKKSVTNQVRRALFAGPYRLLDEATTKRRFPYIPFFAFRTDADNTPYGLIHGMLSAQDEYNERRMRIQWMLKAQQLLVDNDALDETYNNIKDISDSMMRPDMVAVLKASRRNANGLTFRNDFALQKEQYEVMQDSKQLIQDVPGVYSTQLGNAPTGVTSGLAINSLVEQGLVAMGELNDNYGFSRRQTYEALTDLISEDLQERNLQIAIGTGQTRRVVVLNTVDPQTGRPMNIVKDAPIKVGLSEVPASPAYQAQMSQMMGDMIRGLAGTPQASMLIPAWVEQTSTFGPGRKMLADDMRRMSGLPTGGDRQGAQQWQQQQQEQQQQMAQLQQANTQLEMAGKQGKAELDHARAALTKAQTALASVQAAQLVAGAHAPSEDQLIQQALAEAMG